MLCYAVVNRPISEGEDPCEVVDFWGKSKVGVYHSASRYSHTQINFSAYKIAK
jgi:hypothetical protein